MDWGLRVGLQWQHDTQLDVDGDDIQERANAAYSPYWGAAANVYQRVEGYGIQHEGSEYILAVYETREAAETHLVHVGSVEQSVAR